MKKIIDIKYFMIVMVCATVVIFIIALIIHLSNKHSEYMLDSMYDVYPSEVKELYRYLVDANCDGDIKFSVELDEETKLVSELDKNNLRDYLFNHLEKKGYLQDSMPISTINEVIKELFKEDNDLISGIDSYNYDGYTYTFNGDNVTRKKNECDGDIKYVSHLYGYSNKDETLWLDINLGYLKDDIMYELDGKELGRYDNNKEELFKNSPYYRVYYEKDNGSYKINKVKYVSKSFTN